MSPRPIALLFTVAVAAVPVSADVIYQTDFENGAGPQWNGNVVVTELAAFTRYLGRYSGTDMAGLAGPAAPVSLLGPGESFLYTVTFDLYAIDSWDGSEPTQGPDAMRVYVNGTKFFDETIANQHTLQSFRPPDIGPIQLGYHQFFPDSIYRGIEVPFTAPGATSLSIKFWGNVLQGMGDESWGIDNVSVSYSVVPAPGAAALLGLAGLAALRRRR